jgi:hypothetical protein
MNHRSPNEGSKTGCMIAIVLLLLLAPCGFAVLAVAGAGLFYWTTEIEGPKAPDPPAEIAAPLPPEIPPPETPP